MFCKCLSHAATSDSGLPRKWSQPTTIVNSKSDIARLNLNIPLTSELRFFSKANPDHAEGDMLVCLCPLTTTNWIMVGIRAFQRMWRRQWNFK